MDYLAAKWGATVAREDAGWTRAGPLEAPPARATDAWPLADQANRGRWTPLASFGDEFSDGVLDTNKWISPHRWRGRAPALFRRSNVDETSGCLTLAMRLEDVSGLTKDTNAHVWIENGTNNHWSVGGVWEAPWRLAADFHVYGFEWTPAELVWHVDGVRVRSMPNTNWHVPMRMIFDSETMPDWFGLPRHGDLPSVFHVDYVRAWAHPDTETLTEDEANAREWPPPAGATH